MAMVLFQDSHSGDLDGRVLGQEPFERSRQNFCNP